MKNTAAASCEVMTHFAPLPHLGRVSSWISQDIHCFLGNILLRKRFCRACLQRFSGESLVHDVGMLPALQQIGTRALFAGGLASGARNL